MAKVSRKMDKYPGSAVYARGGSESYGSPADQHSTKQRWADYKQVAQGALARHQGQGYPRGAARQTRRPWGYTRA
jgi:hypothetical protein